MFVVIAFLAVCLMFGLFELRNQSREICKTPLSQIQSESRHPVGTTRPSAIAEREQTLALGTGEEHTQAFAQLLDWIKNQQVLTPEDRDGLLAYLTQPQPHTLSSGEWEERVNEILNLLRAQQGGVPGLSELMLHMAEHDTNPVLRMYALQHIAMWIPDEPTPEKREAMVKYLHQLLQRPNDPLAGSALLFLTDLEHSGHIQRSAETDSQFQAAALNLITNPATRPDVKISVLHACVDRKQNDILPTARTIAADETLMIPLRKAAIHSIARMGTSAAPADIKFVAELTCPGKAPLPDTGETAVYETDADIDSTNDNEFAFTGFDKSEDEIEKSELPVSTTGPQKPGKFITNTSNSNYDDDQITDYADGFGLIGASGSNKMAVASDLKFIPLEIKLKKPYSASAKIKISYGTVSKPELSSEGLEKHGDGSKLHPYAYTVNKGGLRIWNAKPDERSDGQNEVDDKGNFVNSDTEYTWHQVCKTSPTASATDTLETAQLYVEYVEAYPALAHGKRDITVTITEGNVTTTDIISVTLMPVMLLADNNRDGYMRFEDYLDQTHFNQSYRFWINNDSDQNGGDTSQPAEDNPWAAVNPDCDLGQIGNTCQRNLEDFTRFHVYAPDKENWYSSGLVGMKLKWQQKFFGTAPEIRFYRAVETDGGRKYLSDETVCNDQTFAKDLTPTLGSSACSIPKELHASNSNVYLIYEGVKSGEGRITADLSYENKNIGEAGALYSEIIDIREMYEQKRVQASANFPGPDISTYTAPSGVTTIDDPLNSPIDRAWDEDTDNKSYTICLHGWDKTWYAARSDEQTIFKRMWQRGFKGRYIGFYWPTKNGKTTYNQSEYVAWNCGAAFKGLIDSLPVDY